MRERSDEKSMWRRIDRWLLTRVPDLWLMRVHAVLLVAVVLAVLALVSANLVTVELMNFPDVGVIMSAGLFVTALVAALWAVTYIRRVTPVDVGLRGTGLGLFCTHWACAAVLISPSFVAPFVIAGRFTEVPEHVVDRSNAWVEALERACSCHTVANPKRQKHREFYKTWAAELVCSNFRARRTGRDVDRISYYYLVALRFDKRECESRDLSIDAVLQMVAYATDLDEQTIARIFNEREVSRVSPFTHALATAVEDRILHLGRVWCQSHAEDGGVCRLRYVPNSPNDYGPPMEYVLPAYARPSLVDALSAFLLTYILALVVTMSVLGLGWHLALASGCTLGLLWCVDLGSLWYGRSLLGTFPPNLLIVPMTTAFASGLIGGVLGYVLPWLRQRFEPLVLFSLLVSCCVAPLLPIAWVVGRLEQLQVRLSDLRYSENGSPVLTAVHFLFAQQNPEVIVERENLAYWQFDGIPLCGVILASSCLLIGVSVPLALHVRMRLVQRPALR